jgi:hypothetical protein
MANTYKLISSNTLGSTAASVTFSSIPSTYTDLVLKCSTRDTNAAQWVSAFLQVNSTTSSYSYTYLRGNGEAVVSQRDTAQAKFFVANNNADASTSSTFSNFEIYIPNYAGATNKVIYSNAAGENNSTTPVYLAAITGLLSNTSAVTSLTMLASTSFIGGSSFNLYGVKNT